MLRKHCGALMRHGCWLLARHSSSCQQQVASHNSSLAVLRRCFANCTRSTVDARHQALPPCVAGLGSSTAAAASEGFTQSSVQRHGASSSTRQLPSAAGGWWSQHSSYSSYSSWGPCRDNSSVHSPTSAATRSLVSSLRSVRQAQQPQLPRAAAAAAAGGGGGMAWPLVQQQWLWLRTYTTEPRVGAPTGPSVQPAQLTVLMKQQTSLAGLQLVLQRHSSIVNAIHVNAALQWLVTHPQEQPCSRKELAALVQKWMGWVEVDQLTARLCANLAYCCSKLGYVEDLGLYRALLQRFMVVKGEADPQGVSNLLYVLGSQEQLRGLLKQDVMVALLQRLKEVARTATPQNLSNALWAAAKVEPGDSAQLKAVVAQLLSCFLKKADAAQPQAFSNTLYALALLPKAWHMGSALQLVERLVQLLPLARPQDMANVVWAMGQYAERGWLAPVSKQWMAAATRLLEALATGKKLVKDTTNKEFSVVVTPQNLSNGCWGMAKLVQVWYPPPGQQQQWQAPFSKAVRTFVPLLPKATLQGLTIVLWACAEVRHNPQQLLQVLTAAALLPQLQQANSQSVANLAYALAVLAPDPPLALVLVFLMQRLQHLLAQQPAAVSSQELANTAWAVGVLDQQQLARQLEPLAAAAFSQQRWDTRQAKDLLQWYQVHLWLTDTQVLGPVGLGALPGVTQQQLEQCAAAWEEGLATDSKASRGQKEVAKVLSSMPGVEVAGTELHDQHDSSRIIDIVTRYKGHLLAVEVDGPTHFTWPGQRPTGITLARNRALGRRGYRVVCVPLNPGWDQQRGLREQQQYLQGLLDIALTSTDLHKTPTDSSISDSPKDDQPQ